MAAAFGGIRSRPPGRLQVIRENITGTGLRRAELRIGRLLVGRMQRGFETQGRGPNKWSPRGIPWIAGVLKDLEAGPSVRPVRFQGRPALVGDDNEPMASIAFETVSPGVIDVGSRKEYAADYHRPGGGPPKQLPVRPEVKRNLGEYLKANPGRAKSLGFLMGKTEITVRTARRPYVVILPEDTITAAEILSEEAQR